MGRLSHFSFLCMTYTHGSASLLIHLLFILCSVFVSLSFSFRSPWFIQETSHHKDNLSSPSSRTVRLVLTSQLALEDASHSFSASVPPTAFGLSWYLANWYRLFLDTIHTSSMFLCLAMQDGINVSLRYRLYFYVMPSFFPSDISQWYWSCLNGVRFMPILPFIFTSLSYLQDIWCIVNPPCCYDLTRDNPQFYLQKLHFWYCSLPQSLLVFIHWAVRVSWHENTTDMVFPYVHLSMEPSLIHWKHPCDLSFGVPPASCINLSKKRIWTLVTFL